MTLRNTGFAATSFAAADKCLIRRQYVQVGVELRRRLLDVIGTKRLSIKAAANEVGINYSTAKNIVKIYRRERRTHKLSKKSAKEVESEKGVRLERVKKVSRFMARKCSLFEENEPLSSAEAINSAIESNNAMVSLENKRDEKITGPVFNFLVYKHLIVENWMRRAGNIESNLSVFAPRSSTEL
eukprot:TRINITY_DN3422_c0_g1_i2.p1 TRINITY_DN3422_c0_g1~~TRINITY_DN3422_c0_g1_i2.p1  ORF type:complete len:184 (+),score=26.36 TRINITY_DN3422_c0_g1_i2:215-766(+)